MKCQNCGGEMDSRAIRCPYCNSENKEGILFQEQVQKKLERYKFLKPFILKKKTPEMVSKYMTRLLFIFSGINVILVGAIFAVFIAGEWKLKPTEPKPDTYAGKFTDYEQGSFYIDMNDYVEKIQSGELPSAYEVESLIESSWRFLTEEEKASLEEADLEGKALAVALLRDVLGLTKEETEYLKEQSDGTYYLENGWLEGVAVRVLEEMEETK